jgi:cytochrome c-type biogenesis protein
VGPFAEALRSTVQPCTLLLIAPALAISIALRNRWSALGAIVGAAIVGGWLLAANRFVVDGIWVRVVAVLVATALLATLPQVHERFPVFGTEGAAVAVAGTVTFVATLWWRPCVGTELGAVLNGAQDGVASELLPMTLYMLGAMVPVAIVVFAQAAIEPPERVTRLASWAALGVGLVIAASLMAGQHDEFVAALTRWTLE